MIVRTNLTSNDNGNVGAKTTSSCSVTIVTMAGGGADPDSVFQVLRARSYMIFIANCDSCTGEGRVSVLGVIWVASLNSSME